MTQALSLHVGVNVVNPDHYAGWSGPLAACEADAEDLQRVADREGYTTKLLLTADATRDSVLSFLSDAAEQLDAGDILLVSYAGHGGQLPDRNGDEDDMTDETWCLYDGQLLDDELAEQWARFQAGVRILVLSDSCHSGTVTRAAYAGLSAAGAMRGLRTAAGPAEEPVYRIMPSEAALRTYRANRSFYDKLQEALPPEGEETEIQACVRLLSGCQDNQLSADGTFNGLFTGTLLRVWNDGAFQGDYAAFHRKIVGLMPPTQSPNHYVIGTYDADFAAQKPFQI